MRINALPDVVKLVSVVTLNSMFFVPVSVKTKIVLKLVSATFGLTVAIKSSSVSLRTSIVVVPVPLSMVDSNSNQYVAAVKLI